MSIVSIPENDRRELLVAAAGQTVFSFDFPVYEASDIRVVRNRGGIDTDLRFGPDFSVAGAGEQGGGTITLSVPAQAGDLMVVLSAMPNARQAQFVNGGDFSAQAIEAELNRSAIARQQIEQLVRRSIRAAESDAEPPTVPPRAQRANRNAVWDANGNLIAADLLTTPAIINRGPVDATAAPFNADPTGVANSSPAINAALATGRDVYLPRGLYRLLAKLTMSITGQMLFGDPGIRQTRLLPVGNFNMIEMLAPAEHVGMQDIYIDATGMTGGYLWAVLGADRVRIERIRFDFPFNVLYGEGINKITLNDWFGQVPRGTVALDFFGAGPSLRTDVVELNNITIGGPLGGRNWIGLRRNGFVAALDARNVRFVAPRIGWHDLNTSGFPEGPIFGEVNNFQVDFPLEQSIRLDAGDEYKIHGLYANESANTAGFTAEAGVRSIKTTSGYIRGNNREAIDLNARDIFFGQTQLIFNSQPATNHFTFPAARLRGNVQRAHFAASALGQVDGIGATVSYGAIVENGARGVYFVGCSFDGCLLGDVLDNSGGPVGNVQVIGSGDTGRPHRARMAGFDIGVADGRDAQFVPAITSGQILTVAVSVGGADYTIPPLLFAVDPSGAGSGWTGTAVISGRQVASVTVLTPGAGYGPNTRVFAVSATRSPTIKARGTGANAQAAVEADGTSAVVLGNDQGTAFSANALDPNSVNFIQARGRSTGLTPDFIAVGADADIGIGLFPKGTNGRVFLGGQSVQLPVFTFATLPAPALATGGTVRVSDRAQRLATSDGTNWRDQAGAILT